MKKILFTILILFIAGNAFAVDKWRAGTGANTILGSSNISDIDTNSYSSIVAPLDRVLSNYREGVRLKYNSASSVTVESGEIVCSNAAGTIRMLSKNTSSISTTWSVTTNGLDTGAEASGTTYYIFAIATLGADTFTVLITTSSTAPSGATYYKRLGSFVNDGSSNITTVTNDDERVIITTGSITNGGTISLPSGWAADECSWSLIPFANDGTHTYTASGLSNGVRASFSTSSRVVTSQFSGGTGDPLENTTSGYIIGCTR